MPPRKTSTSTAPKRRRRTAAASGPAKQKSYLLGPEEKRQLILAHAQARQPVDSMQRFSLWAGVIICVMAIGIGWAYTMRQTIVDAMEIRSQNISADEDALTTEEAKEKLHNNLQSALQKLETLEQQNSQELLKQMAENTQNSSTIFASTTQAATNTDQVLTDTNQTLPEPEPAPEPQTKTQKPTFPIPPGVEIDL